MNQHEGQQKQKIDRKDYGEGLIQRGNVSNGHMQKK